MLAQHTPDQLRSLRLDGPVVGVAMRNASGVVLGSITTSSIDSRMTRDDQQAAAACIAKHIARVQSPLDIL